MEARLAGHRDGLDIAQIEPLVHLAQANRPHRKKVVRSHPYAGSAKDSAPMAGQLAIGFRGHVRLLIKYATPTTQPAISARAIDMPSTTRHRLCRTRLSGRFHVAKPSTSAAGAAAKVNGQIN